MKHQCQVSRQIMQQMKIDKKSAKKQSFFALFSFFLQSRKAKVKWWSSFAWADNGDSALRSKAKQTPQQQSIASTNYRRHYRRHRRNRKTSQRLQMKTTTTTTTTTEDHHPKALSLAGDKELAAQIPSTNNEWGSTEKKERKKGLEKKKEKSAVNRKDLSLWGA